MEKLYVVIMAYTTTLVFGFTVSIIGSIFAKLKQKNDKILNKMTKINSFLKRNKITEQLAF
jgi:hypothetical protein